MPYLDQECKLPTNNHSPNGNVFHLLNESPDKTARTLGAQNIEDLKREEADVAPFSPKTKHVVTGKLPQAGRISSPEKPKRDSLAQLE